MSSVGLNNVLILWFGRIGVNVSLPCAGQASFNVHQGCQQQWPLTLILYLAACVSVSVCRCHDCGERCDLTTERCAAWCEDWEPINTLPFFTPHISLMFIVLSDCVWLFIWAIAEGCAPVSVYCITVVLRCSILYKYKQSVPAFFKLLFQVVAEQQGWLRAAVTVEETRPKGCLLQSQLNFIIKTKSKMYPLESANKISSNRLH